MWLGFNYWVFGDKPFGFDYVICVVSTMKERKLAFVVCIWFMFIYRVKIREHENSPITLDFPLKSHAIKEHSQSKGECGVTWPVTQVATKVMPMTCDFSVISRDLAVLVFSYMVTIHV